MRKRILWIGSIDKTRSNSGGIARNLMICFLFGTELFFASRHTCGAEGTLSATGTLRGYFLTPRGCCQQRTIALSTHPRPPNEILHPLHSGYYLRINAKSSGAPLEEARILELPSGRVLLKCSLTKPAHEIVFPRTDKSWLRAWPEEGLAVLVVARFQGGELMRRVLRPNAVRLSYVPELRIDWLDLVRIKEVRRFLRTKGDRILAGLRADRVPFALEGENGQWVLVDHPKPPLGFRRYTGPSPLAGSITVGHGLPLSEGNPCMMTVAGVPTAVLPYPSAWYALPESGAMGRTEESAVFRLRAMVHEACHVVWSHRRGKFQVEVPPEVLEFPKLETRARNAAEIEALSAALGAETLADASARTREYLALRAHLDASTKEPAAALRTLDQIQTTEGFAYYADMRARQLASERHDFALLKATDPYLENLLENSDTSDQVDDLMDSLKALQDSGHWLVRPSLGRLHGFAHTLLLDKLTPGGVCRAWAKGQFITEALADITGYAQLGRAALRRLDSESCKRWQCAEKATEIRQETEDNASELRASVRAAETKAEGVVFRIRADFAATRGHRLDGLGEWHYLDELAWSSSGSLLAIEGPCFFRSRFTRYGAAQEATTVLNLDDLLWLRRSSSGVRIRTGKVVVQAPFVTVQRSKNTVVAYAWTEAAVRAAGVNTRKKKQEMNRTKWLVIPLAAMMMQGTANAQLPHHVVTASVSGVFLNGDTGQQQCMTLDLMSEAESPSGNWYYVAGEQYSATTSMSDTQYSRVGRVALYNPDGALINESTAQPPVVSLTTSGTFTVSIGGKLKGGIKFTHTPDCVWTFEINIEKGESPPIVGGTMIIAVADGSNPGGWVQQASVSTWKEGDLTTRQTSFTDGNGLATFANLTSGNYLVEISGVAPVRCDIRRGPFKVKNKSTVKDGVVLWQHTGFNGKVWFKDGNGAIGAGQPDRVQVQLYQGQGSQLVGGLAVGTQQQTGGWYLYSGPVNGPPAAGDYTLKATYTPLMGVAQVKTSPATVPDDCGAAHPNTDGGTTVLRTGAHVVIGGAEFIFTVGGGGGPGGGQGGGP